ncbi:hypothetical protein CDEST_05919 [Colletotrichum destructivum]|uniref:Uncharacterized protein n=1 Tax=Colletotrichum destructivum TaxID=34406 RepID=A0AAX4IBZ1_9PEZI|nr:hypothetical protein CDEST_05919 [Colletotrichum destructivum]
MAFNAASSIMTYVQSKATKVAFCILIFIWGIWMFSVEPLRSALRSYFNAWRSVPKKTLRHSSTASSAQLHLHSFICPDIWWDIEKLIESMGELCPDMHISPCHENPRISNASCPSRHGTVRSGHITTTPSVLDVTPENPLLLRHSDSHIVWDCRISGELTTPRKALFRALPHNKTLLAIGEEIFNFGGPQGGNYVGITYVPSTTG